MHSLASPPRDGATGLQEASWYLHTPQLWDKEHSFPIVKFLPSERHLQDHMQNQFSFHLSVLSPALLSSPFPASSLLCSVLQLQVLAQTAEQDPGSPSRELNTIPASQQILQHTWGEAICLTKSHAGSPAGCQGMGGRGRQRQNLEEHRAADLCFWFLEKTCFSPVKCGENSLISPGVLVQDLKCLIKLKSWWLQENKAEQLCCYSYRHNKKCPCDLG